MEEKELMDNDALNATAMQIIMLAGDGRCQLNEAVEELEKGNDEKVDQLLKEAKEKITAAHRLQTDVIQSTLESEDFKPSLLFIHAQDTLMTINSEMNLVGHLCRLFRKKDE